MVDGKKRMPDAANDQKELIAHLQAALDLCDGSAMPTLGYLIARALDEARAADWETRRHSRGLDQSLD
jgi:hypothetical protein